MMTATGLLLLTALCSLSHNGLGDPSKQELLVRSKRDWVLSTLELQEEDPGPYPKVISKIFNVNAGNNHEFLLSGKGVDQEPFNVFTLDSHTGEVFVHRAIDREQYKSPFHIRFDIVDKDTKERLDEELSFDVLITDINDNAPTFSDPQMTFEVKENATKGYLLGQLQVTDRDLEEEMNSRIIMTFISQEPMEPKIGLKQLSNNQAILFLKSGCFDYDKIKKYEVLVKAQDQGQPSLSSTGVITLNIADGNTHPPMFKDKEYQGEVMEMLTQDDVLRVTVEDNDTPNTPGWRAKYFFIKGNEEGYYKITTDPKTNQGILSVIKGKDYEKTSFVTLEVGVTNEEPRWVCKGNFASGSYDNSYDSAVIKIKVKDVNDPPVFAQNPVVLHETEEEKPGKVLFTPEVKDEDSDISQISYVILEDPGDWVSIDKKTGKIISVKKMDRESPFLNGTGIYNIVIGAIDTGEPPATGTCTVQIHLSDINDNKPQLVNKGIIFCANKSNMVMVAAKDADNSPYAGPFFFSLKNDDKVLEQWKLDPSSGAECGLVSKKALHYGNYSVPLEIRDQQNMLAKETLEVMVCDCEGKDVCRSNKEIRTNLGPAGIGMVFVALLSFLLLLLIFACQCGKDFKHSPSMLEEGNQTLMNYNQEAGMSECKIKPTQLTKVKTSTSVTDSVGKFFVQTPQSPPFMMDGMCRYNSSTLSPLAQMNSNMTLLGRGPQRAELSRKGVQSSMNSDVTLLDGWRQRESLSRSRVQTTNYSLNKVRNNSSYSGNPSRHNLLLDQHVADQISRRLYTIDRMDADSPASQPFPYTYEGQGSRCPSLDGISLITLGDDLTFLNNLGPTFNTLGQICQQRLEEDDIEL